jgi:hypothetical protein
LGGCDLDYVHIKVIQKLYIKPDNSAARQQLLKKKASLFKRKQKYKIKMHLVIPLDMDDEPASCPIDSIPFHFSKYKLQLK